ncbi:MAG: hypothetical protein KBS41_00340 [Oscillospiraceae bacterium]|nr:hypothetical protein [Candidatus Equicaccousia limihippi]
MNITLPIIDRENMERYGGREAVMEQINRMGSKRLLLATGTLKADNAERNKMFSSLKDNVAYFKSQGLEVGAWHESTWVEGYNEFVKIKGANGAPAGPHACFSDKNFQRFVGEYCADCARAGVDIILFDDDFKYAFYFGGATPCCFCENHMKMIYDEIGEQLTPEELANKAISGGKNKYRTAWLNANGKAIEEFCLTVRKYVDAVNPNVRMGVCSEMSLWDYGIDSVKVARLLAGKTKPFLRLIGAPYWAVKQSIGNSRLAHTIELERMERSWCPKGDEIEILAEGDSYPRPRHECPANFLEIYHTALIADGTIDNILKYTLNYQSNISYDNGYIVRHEKNQPLYKSIEKAFGGKEHVGVRIYEQMQKLEQADIPAKMQGSGKIEDIFFSPAAKMLADASVPSTYYGEGVCGIAFGENIKYVPKSAFSHGLIIDIAAARYLQNNGVDVGLIKTGNTFTAPTEHFVDYNEYTFITHLWSFEGTEVEISDKAIVKSNFVMGENNKTACYTYENADGQRFMVFCFEGYFNGFNFTRGYMRSKQIADGVKWLCGKSLPAYSYGNPDLYIIAKEKDGEMAVGLWNIYADEIIEPVVELSNEYSQITAINCTAKVEGNKVYLSDIAPYAFAGFTVK